MSELSFDIKIPRGMSGDSKPKARSRGQPAQAFRWLGGLTWTTALLWSVPAVLLLCLIPVSVRITSVKGKEGAPVGYFTQEQWVDISGKISDRRAKQVFLNLNGSLRPISANIGKFQSRVSLVPGINRIVVSPSAQVLPLLGQSETVRLFAVVPPSDIWSELTWDGIADLDLHLVEPTGEECFYKNCLAIENLAVHGATLDYDNKDGYGPEHITMFSAIPGAYKLYVHYYGGPGGAMRWRVNLRLAKGSLQKYSGVLDQKRCFAGCGRVQVLKVPRLCRAGSRK